MATLLEVKGVATLSLVAGSFLVGLIPSWLGFGTGANQLEHSLLLSAILCFGAGVLLSTALVHILGE
ncbi:hypothetical protein LSTR_LSTR016671 [Laodelphax striatellus]|uniref:Uncharacterized protein n=1 Tax=Laodelphax striatellus TaxID=195883 RepID=A0A482X519_LAOST|nr:hypothetical protein LSTR_LSTR016671 [Laodelphax striatellus]